MKYMINRQLHAFECNFGIIALSLFNSLIEMYSGKERYFTVADKSACYYTFFTISSEKCGILC